MKKFINPLLSLGTAIALLGAIYFQNQEIDSLKKQKQIEPVVGTNSQNIIDSLHDEIFILHTMNGRYELSLDHLNEVNPKAGKEFTNFMESETE